MHHPGNTYHSEILKGSGGFDVLQCGGQILQLQINTALGFLRVLHGLGLKGLNGLDLPGNIVGRGLEGAEVLLDLINDGLVLQERAVVREIDGLWLLREGLHAATGVITALLESLQGGGCLATETERAGHLGPVEFEGCAALEGREVLAMGLKEGTANQASRELATPRCLGVAGTKRHTTH